MTNDERPLDYLKDDDDDLEGWVRAKAAEAPPLPKVAVNLLRALWRERRR